MILVYDANSLCCSIVFDFNVSFYEKCYYVVDCIVREVWDVGELFPEIIELEMTFVNTITLGMETNGFCANVKCY